ncbi:MAG: hypothetical protein ACREFK_08710 [Stellaceae bacterium]
MLSCTGPKDCVYRFRVAIGSARGTVHARTDTASVIYGRCTRLGEIIHRNSRGERGVLSAKLREITGNPDLARWYYGL